jgi:hypothetical protein
MEDFISENGISFTQFEIARKDKSFYIIAKEDIPIDTVVATIPIEAVLSTRNCTISNLLHSEEYEEHQIDGPIALAVALFYERKMEKRSRWYGYLQALPEYEPLPLYWFSKVAKGYGIKRSKVACKEAAEYLKCLENTEISDLKADYSLLWEDFQEIVVPFFEFHSDRLGLCKTILFLEFLYCSTIVASRSFEVDEYHGVSLVPLADLFNHSFEENVHLESDENTNDSIEFRVVRDCTSGQEIFNTYGMHSNTYLLMKYGFCETGNPFDIISFPIAEVLLALRSQFDVEKRTQWWLEVGYRISNIAETVYFKFNVRRVLVMGLRMMGIRVNMTKLRIIRARMVKAKVTTAKKKAKMTTMVMNKTKRMSQRNTFKSTLTAQAQSFAYSFGYCSKFAKKILINGASRRIRLMKPAWRCMNSWLMKWHCQARERKSFENWQVKGCGGILIYR